MAKAIMRSQGNTVNGFAHLRQEFIECGDRIVQRKRYCVRPWSDTAMRGCDPSSYVLMLCAAAQRREYSPILRKWHAFCIGKERLQALQGQLCKSECRQPFLHVPFPDAKPVGGWREGFSKDNLIRRIVQFARFGIPGGQENINA